MSSDHWQQAKRALAEAITLPDARRADFLSQLQSNAPEVHEEVVSLLGARAAAEKEGFLDGSAETMDQYRTETYDPAQTREFLSGEDLVASSPRSTQGSHELVGEDYELEKKIGQGGMGVVYKAYHRSLRRTVALKIISGGGLRDEIDIARFHIEAEAAARLDHPGIIPVYDVGEHNGNHYYAMAYIEGQSLSEFVGKKAKRLTPRRAAELMEQVCQAVQFAHDRAVIHRDLKPANIMLENGEVPRLADFGLAKNMHEEDGLTMTGQVMGTPSYMAPEQATGKLDEISNRTDVYSLGATLYALLAGKPPFSGGTMLETIRQVVRTEPESLTHVSHPVPRDLQTICEKCLAKNPQDRYASAADVAEDLRRYLDGFPISARPLAAWERGVRWCQRNPLESALLGVTAAALLIGTIVSLQFGLEANRALADSNRKTQQVLAALDEAFVFASENVLSQEPGMQEARAVLLNTAQKYYAELVKLTPRDAESLRGLADAQFMLGRVQMVLGETVEARSTLIEALKIQQQLVEQTPDDAAGLTALAKTHNQLATFSQKSWQSLTQLQSMADLPAADAVEAETQLEDWQHHSADVVRLRKQVVALEPADQESKRLLASATMNEGIAVGTRGYARHDLGEQDRARQIILRAQQIRLEVLREASPKTDAPEKKSAETEEPTTEEPDSEDSNTKEPDKIENPNATDVIEAPEQIATRRDLARGYYNLAFTELTAADQELDDQAYQQRLQQSAVDLTDAIDAYQKLPRRELVLDVQAELARCYRLRADTYFRSMAIDRAAGDYQQAEKLLLVLTTRNPNVNRYRVDLAEAQFNFCGFWFSQQQQERAAIQLANTRATLLQALRIDPNELDAAEQIVRFTQNIVEPLLEKKDFDMAERVLEEALQELLALQQESEEYSRLSGAIEELEALARRVLKERAHGLIREDVAQMLRGPF